MLSKEWGLLLGVSQTLYPPSHPKKKRRKKEKKGKQIIITQTHRERCINNGGQGDIFQRSNERPIRGLPWPSSSPANCNQSKALCGRRHFLVFQLLVSYVLLPHLISLQIKPYLSLSLSAWTDLSYLFYSSLSNVPASNDLKSRVKSLEFFFFFFIHPSCLAQNTEES